MAIVRGIVFAITCAVLFAIGGGLVATALNRLAPGYYPGVFPYANEGGTQTKWESALAYCKESCSACLSVLLLQSDSVGSGNCSGVLAPAPWLSSSGVLRPLPSL